MRVRHLFTVVAFVHLMLACDADQLPLDAHVARDASGDASVADDAGRAESSGAVVASYYPAATEIGAEVLRDGGNAVDAFVATALAEWVVAPGVTTFAGNFGAMVYESDSGELLHLDGEYNNVLDPMGRFSPGDEAGKSVAVFGSIRALFALHERFGSRPFADLAAPAIALAEGGFAIDAYYSYVIEYRRDVLTRSEYGRSTYFPDGSAIAPGEVLELPEVARFLRGLSAEGADYMYRGEWAERCVQEVQAQGGKLEAEDLWRYRALFHAPRRSRYRGLEIAGPGGRFYGGLAVQLMLGALDQTELDTPISESAESFALALGVARATLFESWLVNGSMLDDETSIEAHLSSEASAARLARGMRSHTLSTRARGSHSTSLAVADASGNFVVATHSINALPWGEGIFVQGVALNAGAQWANQSAAGERRTSPLATHVVLDEGRPLFASSTWNVSLIEAQLQFLIGAIDHELSLDELATRPRFGSFAYTVPEFVADTSRNIADPRFSAEFVEDVRARGFELWQPAAADIGLGTLLSLRGIRSAANATDYSGLRGSVIRIHPR